MNKWIYKLAELEEIVGILYLKISKLLEKKDQEISEVFFELYMDEIQHGKQVDFAKTLYSESESIFSDNSENLSKIENSLKMIGDINKLIDKDGPEMSSLDFLKIALDLEENFAEGHLLVSLEIEDDNIKRLLQTMMNEDKIHIARIQRIIDNLTA